MKMHPNFADWYQPVTFGHDRGVLDLRWQGLEAFLSEFEFGIAQELIRLVFDRPALSAEAVGGFREHFKKIDPTFATSGNDREVQVLAGCTLAVICLDENPGWDEVAAATLTTSACGRRVPKVEIDLIGMATERMRMDGIRARKRPEFSKMLSFSNKKLLDEANALLEKTQNVPTAIEAIRKFGGATENVSSYLQKALIKRVNQLHKVLTIQDEELQFLWWMVGGWSAMWKKAFKDIEIRSRPILLAKEAANMTAEFTEPPSLKALFSRLGIDGGTKITIPDAINACGLEHLGTLAPKEPPCPTIFPLHFALHRALETKGGAAWISGWSKVTNISKKVEINSLDLAVQYHRELKIMMLP
ncbi:MAG: hypothetical protein C4576_20185 [Desulfobacteraceae bacterium]|nr:MAG: hypothetical protein C4576_20185 [Desulfobacteraceae bacterium]